MRKFEVLFVQNNSEGLVEHFGHNVKDDGPSFTDLCSGDHVIQLVRLTVNSDMRRMHSHLHSVGHMIDAAMKEIGYNELIFRPTKGYHFTDGPYVEYEIIDADTLDHVNSNKNSDRFFEEMACLLQQTLIELVERKIETTVVYVPRCEDERDNITRIVSVAGCECPCGGTHIDNTGEITEKIIISKIKRKRSTIKVNYSLEV